MNLSEKTDLSALQTASVCVAAALYVMGAFVTSIHLSRLGIYELPLAKITYFFAGASCAFYLANRLLVAVLIIYRKHIYSAFAFPGRSMLRRVRGRISRGEKSFPHRGMYRLASSLVHALPALAVAYLFLLITIPASVIYIRLFDFSETNAELAWLGRPVPTGLILVFFQAVIFLVLLLKKPMFESLASRRLWHTMASILLLSEVILYSLAIHPIVRPAFGGGRAVSVDLIPKDEISAKTLAQHMGVHNDIEGDTSEVFVLHETASHLYVSTHYRLNYSAPNLPLIIEHGSIFRLSRNLLSGFVIAPKPNEIAEEETR